MTDLTEWRVGRNFIRLGDVVKITSSPGKRDSYRAKVRRIQALWPTLIVTQLEVIATSGKQEGSTRTVRPERVRRLAQSKIVVRQLELPKPGRHKAGKR